MPYFCAVQLSAVVKYFLFAISIILLGMMIFFPPGYDQFVFSVGGEMVIKNGALPYRDFLDTKPPLIFYIYGVALWLFGHHEWSIRIFDIVYHLVALTIFYRIVKEHLKDETLAALSVFLYSVLYTASGYWMTAQAETFALLPCIIILDRSEAIRTRKKYMASAALIGIMSVILLLLKQTLVVVPLGAAIYLLTRKETNHALPAIIVSIFTFAALFGIYAFYIAAVGGLERLVQSIQWVIDYSAIEPFFSQISIVRTFYHLFTEQLLTALSFSFTVLLGTYFYLRIVQDSRTTHPFADHLLIQLLFGLAAVLIERKCFPYHYSRIYFAAVPLIALVVAELWQRWKNSSQQSFMSRTVGFIALAIFLFYSPVLRVITQPLRWAAYSVFGSDKRHMMQLANSNYPIAEVRTTSDKIRTMMKPDDEIFFWGNHLAVYFDLNKLPTTITLTNTPIITRWAPPEWKQSVLNTLRSQPTEFFVVERRDHMAFINDSPLDSWQQLQEWTEMKTFLSKNYTFADSGGRFMIFKRK